MIKERELPTSKCGFPPCEKIGGVVIKKDTETKEFWISCNYCRTNWNGYIISAEDEETIEEFIKVKHLNG